VAPEKEIYSPAGVREIDDKFPAIWQQKIIPKKTLVKILMTLSLQCSMI
jgi:hypothetical protein